MQVSPSTLRLHVVDVHMVARRDWRVREADDLAVLAHLLTHRHRSDGDLMPERYACADDDPARRQIEYLAHFKVSQRNSDIVRRMKVVGATPDGGIRHAGSGWTLHRHHGTCVIPGGLTGRRRFATIKLPVYFRQARTA